MSERSFPLKAIAIALAGVVVLAAALVVGRVTANTSPLPDASSTRFILIIDEDETGRLSVNGADSRAEAYAPSPDNPRRFLDPIPVDCDEALAGVESVTDMVASASLITEEQRPLYERHVVVAQHTCSFERYVRFLEAGFADWLYGADTASSDAAEADTTSPDVVEDAPATTTDTATADTTTTDTATAGGEAGTSATDQQVDVGTAPTTSGDGSES